MNNKRVDEIWRSLEVTPSSSVDTFTEDMVASLPSPVRRYFLHAIEPGTSLASSVHLKMSGTFKPKRDAQWMSMQAEQLIAIPKGFVWKATVRQRFLQLTGADYYSNGSGQMRFSLWGMIPVVNASNPDVAKSGIGRMAVESIWLPSALLPQQGVHWEAIDETSATAHLELDGEPVTLTFVIDSEGKLLKVSLLRWSDQGESGQFTYIPFGGIIKEESKFGGFTIPSKMGVGWWFDTERYFEFFRATVESAEFR
ncbi:MAG TPA: DUF6544 family protein [Coleofasciculaceae cyanobacterium]